MLSHTIRMIHIACTVVEVETDLAYGNLSASRIIQRPNNIQYTSGALPGRLKTREIDAGP